MEVIADVILHSVMLIYDLDLLLVQVHLKKLRSTHRPAPSLYHTLANRLDTWLQSMNTPPTPVRAQEFNLAWSLFDQNSIQIASKLYYEQNTLDGMSNIESTAETSRAPSSSLNNQQSQNYGNPEYWNSCGNLMSAEPVNFTRLFGNTAFHGTSDDDSHMQ